MTSLKEYQERINQLAESKGWSDNIHWLELGVFKEVGELVQAIEKYQDAYRTWETDADAGYYRRIVTPAFDNISKEFGDVLFFLFQTMRHYDINLDEALEMVIEDNTTRKKKTIDENGNIVRK